MDFLKRFFGGGGSAADDGMTVMVYIKITRTGEIVPLRLRRGYDISQSDDGRHFARKLVMGKRSFERVEAELYFNAQGKVVDAELSGGELVSAEEYYDQQAPQE